MWSVALCFLSSQRRDVKPVWSAKRPSLSRVSGESRCECLSLLFSYLMVMLQMCWTFFVGFFFYPAFVMIVFGCCKFFFCFFRERSWNLSKPILQLCKSAAIPPSVSQNSVERCIVDIFFLHWGHCRKRKNAKFLIITAKIMQYALYLLLLPLS